MTEKNRPLRLLWLLLALVLLSGLTACRKPNIETKHETPEPPPVTEPAPKEPETKDPEPVTEETVEDLTKGRDSFLPGGPLVRCRLFDDLDLVLEGTKEEAPYARYGSCFVYHSVRLEGDATSPVTLFEEMPIPVNSDYGSLRCRVFGDLSLVVFNAAAQIGGDYAVLIDEKSGGVVKEFRNVEITDEVEEPKAFLVRYVCGRDGDKPVYDLGRYPVEEELWRYNEGTLTCDVFIVTNPAATRARYQQILYEVVDDLTIFDADPDESIETYEVDGVTCYLLKFGTYHKESDYFVVERTYAVGDYGNRIFAYDPVSDSWTDISPVPH